MSDDYYIRIRGEVKGPLTRQQIATQIRRKRLGRHHELSADAIDWQKAGDMQEFFEPKVTAKERVVALEAEKKDDERIQSLPDSESSANTVDDEWYYTKGGNKLGPVPASEIQIWLSSGRLKGDDLVWNASFENWIPVADLPQFAAIAVSQERSSPDSLARASFWEIFLGTSRAATLPADAVKKYPNLTRYLKIAESSLRIIFVLSLVCIVPFLFFFVTAFFSHTDRMTFAAAVLAASVIVCPLSVLVMWLVFITHMAGLEFVRVVIKIEDNSSR